MMYPKHSLLRIYDFQIIFHSGSTCKSKDKASQSIHFILTWKYGTAYILYLRNRFSDRDRYAKANLFGTFDYTIVSHCLNYLHHCKLYE